MLFTFSPAVPLQLTCFRQNAPPLPAAVEMLDKQRGVGGKTPMPVHSTENNRRRFGHCMFLERFSSSILPGVWSLQFKGLLLSVAQCRKHYR